MSANLPPTVSWLPSWKNTTDQIVHHEVFPETSATLTSIRLHPLIAQRLDERGFSGLYQHQADAIRAIRDGTSTVVATPTASGKSLTYVIPALEAALEHDSSTLYIAPTRALINDQAATFRNYAEDLDPNRTITVGEYTGSTPTDRRREIRQSPPDILLTTPDMLHNSLLPYSIDGPWSDLLADLAYVVVDEVHQFRGVFGSHVSNIFRRLQRLCDTGTLDTDPQFICASATIGNPVEHASAVTGCCPDEFTLINTDTSESGRQDWVLWQPPLKDRGDDATDTNTRVSNHQASLDLFLEFLGRGYQTLVFTNARQTAEQYVDQARQRAANAPGLPAEDAIASYHSHLPDETRTTIEHQLRNGEVVGAWTTSALEVGVDIGSLDIVILDGYPGTKMETFQRGGRAGRGTDDSAVVLVGSDDPLDEYIMENPTSLFQGDAEKAAVNNENSAIQPDHLQSAAAEVPLTESDATWFGDSLAGQLDELTDTSPLTRVDTKTRTDYRWPDEVDTTPHYDFSIRSIADDNIIVADRTQIDDPDTELDADSDGVITTISRNEAIRDTHPGAIYYSNGQKYRITDADYDNEQVLAVPLDDTESYTASLTEHSISIQATRETIHIGGVFDTEITLADVSVAREFNGYLEYAYQNDPDPDRIGIDDLETHIPSYTYNTTALSLSLSEKATASIEEKLGDPDLLGAGLHAAQHTLTSQFPVNYLCDRRDISGITSHHHPDTGTATLFIHDTHPGGAGLCDQAFEDIKAILDQSLTRIETCSCTTGCPTCIHHPHCRTGNDNLHKDGGYVVLQALKK
ncbi:DEAD/DEAH box helicase [Halobaculum sp. MBLA0147]|uniref:DEAD/DEAH box helicase n=1 Tax=Halobaculum sp. MBLA0147 TaxID=3079934 RepID=UPI003525E062